LSSAAAFYIRSKIELHAIILELWPHILGEELGQSWNWSKVQQWFLNSLRLRVLMADEEKLILSPCNFEQAFLQFDLAALGGDEGVFREFLLL